MSKKIQITAEEFNRDPAAAIRASRELVVEITQDGEVTTTLHRPQNRILSEDDLHERIEKAKKVAQEVLADPEPESTGVKMAKWIARRKVALDVLRARSGAGSGPGYAKSVWCFACSPYQLYLT